MTQVPSGAAQETQPMDTKTSAVTKKLTSAVERTTTAIIWRLERRNMG